MTDQIQDTPTPASADVLAVVKSLTKAQRTRLNGIAELRARGLSWASRYGSLRINTSRATTSALFAQGLIVDDYGDAILTPLGLAVRAALEQSTRDDAKGEAK